MNVVVYVEGPADEAVMRTLLRPLLERKAQLGIAIDFFEAPSGNKKASVLTKVPVAAVNILRNNPLAIVIAVPDLYPRNIGFPHETVQELRDGMMDLFNRTLVKKGIDDIRLAERFHVFCFKHDLEALVLSDPEALRNRLNVESLVPTWTIPVEDQNHDRPPKRVVEDLFREQGMRYKGAVDASLMLKDADYRIIAERCFQCFKPFVQFLENLGLHTM
ncbi:MAG: DUF4276 family protein [Candidatus Kapaibacterium sp.]